MDCLESVRFQIPMNDQMIGTINDFRRYHNVKPVEHWDFIMSEHCKMHCLEMSRRGEIYHAEPCYLEGWTEAVAMHSYLEHWDSLRYKFIFEVLGTSAMHRGVLLNHDWMAYALWTHNWITYLTVRAR